MSNLTKFTNREQYLHDIVENYNAAFPNVSYIEGETPYVEYNYNPFREVVINCNSYGQRLFGSLGVFNRQIQEIYINDNLFYKNLNTEIKNTNFQITQDDVSINLGNYISPKKQYFGRDISYVCCTIESDIQDDDILCINYIDNDNYTSLELTISESKFDICHVIGNQLYIVTTLFEEDFIFEGFYCYLKRNNSILPTNVEIKGIPMSYPTIHVNKDNFTDTKITCNKVLWLNLELENKDDLADSIVWIDENNMITENILTYPMNEVYLPFIIMSMDYIIPYNSSVFALGKHMENGDLEILDTKVTYYHDIKNMFSPLTVDINLKYKNNNHCVSYTPNSNNIISIGKNLLKYNKTIRMNYLSKITSIVLPETIKRITSNAFANCPCLQNINIPTSVKYIGSNVLTGTELFNNDKNYDEGVLYIDNCLITVNNTANTHLVVKEGTRIIANESFSSHLEKITIPSTVLYLNKDMFNNCENLTEVIVDENNPNYTSIDGVLFNKDKTELLYYPQAKKDNNYTIQDGVQRIGITAFAYNTNIKTIVIPESVTRIEDGAFIYCTSLVSINLPRNLSYISDNLFYYCESLESIILPSNIKYIGTMAFQGCSMLDNITLPSTIEFIGYTAFEGTKIYNNINNWENGVLYIDDFIIDINTENISDVILRDDARLILDIGSFSYSDKFKKFIENNANFFVIDNNGVYSKDKKICYRKPIYTSEFGDTFCLPDSVEYLSTFSLAGLCADNIKLPKNLKYLSYLSLYLISCKNLIIDENIIYISSYDLYSIFADKITILSKTPSIINQCHSLLLDDLFECHVLQVLKDSDYQKLDPNFAHLTFEFLE